MPSPEFTFIVCGYTGIFAIEQRPAGINRFRYSFGFRTDPSGNVGELLTQAHFAFVFLGKDAHSGVEAFYNSEYPPNDQDNDAVSRNSTGHKDQRL